MPSVPDSSRVLDVSIRRRMPHPVASVWHRVSLAIGPVAQREELLRTVPALLRTVALFQLPDYLRGPPVDVVERLLRALERPSDGHWLHLARGLAKAAHERAEPAPFMPEAYAWLLDERGKPTGAARAVEEFIALRNSLRHGRSAAGEAEERERLLQVRERARDVLDRVQWLAGYRPFRVVEQQPTTTPGTFSGRVQMWVGSRELVEPEAATWRAWLVPGRVYVAAPSGRAFLDVDPLLQVLPHPTAKRELLFAFADAPRLKRMRLTHDGSGGEREVAPVLDEREVTFEAWLAARGRAGVAIDNEGDPEVFADPASARSALAGEVLDGRYEIRGVLGEGGTATVYRVWDREFEQEVALKVLHRDLGQDERFCERFRREGRLMARVEHPHLLRVLDLGELVDGRLFLKTPLAAGGSLRDFVGSAPGDATLRRWMRQALGALVALHSAGVVHRDLKPSNLLIDEDGDLMVGDFGVALDPSQRRLTQNLERLGSPAYMAPEQAAQTTVTTAADLYSLAVIWHELLAGSLPDGRPGDGIAAPWSSLLRSLGARAAGERPTASEALSRLDDRGAAVAATPAPAVSEVARGEREASEVTDPTRPTPSASARGASAERPTERSRPRRWPVLISVLVGLGAVVAVGLLLVRSGNQPDRDQAAEASGPDETGAGGAVRPARVIGQDGATLVLVPGTTFGLGLSTAEQVRHRAACQATGSERCNRPGYFDNETPETPVEVSAFYLDRAEVSRAQYAVCVSAGACPPIDEAECQVYDGHDWGAGRQLAAASLRPEVPRTCVMREEAAAYCRWAERRLPTEAEWELAAAGTEGRVFPWGDVFDASRAAFLDQGPQVLVGPDERSSGATSSGIVHLAGNAYEWVADDACDYESRPRGRDPVCHALRERGVVRGGSFLSSGVSLRTSFRRFTSTNSRADNIGFRCAIGASEAERL